MRLIDADELIEHAWRDKLDSRELIVEMIEKAPTIKEIPTKIKIPIDMFERLLGLAEESRDYMKENKEYPDEETLKKQNKNTNRCIDCGHYDAHWLYTDDMRSISPLSLGSCEKCRRNFVSIDPYNQVPSWCPLKGEK